METVSLSMGWINIYANIKLLICDEETGFAGIKSIVVI